MLTLTHAARRSIIHHLRDGELTVGELGRRLGLKPPVVSFHLATLRTAGVVRFRAAQSRRFYRLDEVSILRAWDGYLSKLTPLAEDES